MTAAMKHVHTTEVHAFYYVPLPTSAVIKRGLSLFVHSLASC